MSELHEHVKEATEIDDSCEICASDWYKNMDRSWLRPLTAEEEIEHAQFIWDSTTPEKRVEAGLVEPVVRVPYTFTLADLDDPERKIFIGAIAAAHGRRLFWDFEEFEQHGIVNPAEWDFLN
jgi:hypothetical protein